MTQVWILSALVVALGVATVVLGVALVRLRASSAVAATASRDDAGELRERLDDLERKVAQRPSDRAAADGPEFLITDLSERGSTPAVPDVATPPPGRIDGRLFADLVLRETVVKTAALAYGVGRALSPENRFRMRYEMTREMKRSRKVRRQELRAARRYLQSQRRAEEDAA